MYVGVIDVDEDVVKQQLRTAADPAKVEASLNLASNFVDLKTVLRIGEKHEPEPDVWTPRLFLQSGLDAAQMERLRMGYMQQMQWSAWRIAGWIWDDNLRDWVRDGVAWEATLRRVSQTHARTLGSHGSAQRRSLENVPAMDPIMEHWQEHAADGDSVSVQTCVGCVACDGLCDL